MTEKLEAYFDTLEELSTEELELLEQALDMALEKKDPKRKACATSREGAHAAGFRGKISPGQDL